MSLDLTFLLILSVPLILAAVGETIGQRSGVLNIGLEGMMLVGAFVGFAVGIKSGSVLAATGAATAAGLVLASISAFFVIRLESDQVVVGTAVNLFALGSTGLAFRRMFGQSPTLGTLPTVPKLAGVDLFVPLALIVTVLAWWLLAKTRWGLAIRASGEYPQAVEASGFSVTRLRIGALMIGGALAGLAGCHLTLGVAGSFAEGMTAGRGFLAIALVTFGRWQPHLAALAAVLLGYAQSLQYSLQGKKVFGVEIPSQLWLALPYVLALVVLVLVGSGAPSPKALGRPYER